MTPVVGPSVRPSSSYDHLIKLLLIGDSGTMIRMFRARIRIDCRCWEELSFVEVL